MAQAEIERGRETLRPLHTGIRYTRLTGQRTSDIQSGVHGQTR
jgi:hypothetical protein